MRLMVNAVAGRRGDKVCARCLSSRRRSCEQSRTSAASDLSDATRASSSAPLQPPISSSRTSENAAGSLFRNAANARSCRGWSFSGRNCPTLTTVRCRLPSGSSLRACVLQGGYTVRAAGRAARPTPRSRGARTAPGLSGAITLLLPLALTELLLLWAPSRPSLLSLPLPSEVGVTATRPLAAPVPDDRGPPPGRDHRLSMWLQDRGESR